MRLTRTAVATALLLFTARSAGNARDIDGPRQPEVPMIRTVEPTTGRVGTLHMAVGDFLGAAWVHDLFLTNGKEDVKVQIVRQSDITIEFRVPAVKPGKYSLMVLTRGAEPILIEQPVSLTVQDD